MIDFCVSFLNPNCHSGKDYVDIDNIALDAVFEHAARFATYESMNLTYTTVNSDRQKRIEQCVCST